MADTKTSFTSPKDSAPPPAYDATAGSSSTAADALFQTSFASLSLHMTDRIRLVQFGADDVAAVRGAIRQSWPDGIQAERPYSVSHEFKLRGRPWSGSGTGSYAVPAITLMRDLFACLYARGWILTASTDVSRKELDKDTLIFRRQGGGPPPPASWMAISFKQGDKIRLLGASSELIAALRALLTGMRLLQAQAVKDAARSQYEFKLYGHPWHASGEETMVARLLILRFVEILERHGWSLYASIDQNSGPSGDSSYSETDCWYCVKSSDWTPGSVILHR
ncbi:hypothetical protein ISF_06265 [Cordyceps fumosorosea ARSEF 2679]|uniref:Uncharacterized protein n=1 Tax=Cordyceps fumosorosea (strain ARSEF 2679) TaxID=1081104 RepID=A0A167S789_CORFA|nr:hypothetical protein ISF_06265 [Cordyceps fumosorosea ARSEF 2679]OAA59330.1 hypothetical protein ISF_06265 [Cordyceps fumosorosea ARSEF 2679]